MTAARDLIARVRAAGGVVAPAGPDLDVEALAEVLTDDLVAELRERKDEVLAALRAERAAEVGVAIEAVTAQVASLLWTAADLDGPSWDLGETLDDAAGRYVAGDATRQDLDAALVAWEAALCAARPAPIVRGPTARRCRDCGAEDATAYVLLDDGARLCGRCWRGLRPLPQEVQHAAE